MVVQGKDERIQGKPLPDYVEKILSQKILNDGNNGILGKVSLIKSNNLDKILFVNAWDPYSLVGNGNNMDDSLDGYFGRISAMSILCWSITNPYIKYIES
jgi:hypothetical protein